MSATAIKLKIAQSSDILTAANLRLLLDKIIKMLALPGFGILVFLLLWQLVANNIVTSLGQFPGPTQVW
jgi:nitrate/nitrite transport system permease protein